MKTVKNTIKGGKITVRFFLQKKVQPQEASVHRDGKEKPAYPLYLYITYNRRNMQFKSNYGMFYTDMSEVEKRDRGLMAFEEKLVTKVIRYESSLLPDGGSYDMKGLKDKYEVYATSIDTALETYLKPRLRLAILKTNNELQHALNLNTTYYHNTVLRLYKVSALIFDNFFEVLDKNLHEEIETYRKFSEILPRVTRYDFPTVIDWLEGSYKKELSAFLEKIFKHEASLIHSIYKLIDRAVEAKMKAIKTIEQKYTKDK